MPNNLWTGKTIYQYRTLCMQVINVNGSVVGSRGHCSNAATQCHTMLLGSNSVLSSSSGMVMNVPEIIDNSRIRRCCCKNICA